MQCNISLIGHTQWGVAAFIFNEEILINFVHRLQHARYKFSPIFINSLVSNIVKKSWYDITSPYLLQDVYCITFYNNVFGKI